MLTIKRIPQGQWYQCAHCKNDATVIFKVTEPVYKCDRCLAITLRGLADVYQYNLQERMGE